MDNIQITARLQLDGADPKTVEDVAEQCIERVKQHDPGTNQYDWFLRSDQSECVVRETYEDSEAVLAHLDNLGELLEELNDLGTMSVELYGDPSAELRDALPEDCTYYRFLQGL